MKRKCIAVVKIWVGIVWTVLLESENCTYDQSLPHSSCKKSPKHFFKVVCFLQTLLHRRSGIISSAMDGNRDNLQGRKSKRASNELYSNSSIEFVVKVNDSPKWSSEVYWFLPSICSIGKIERTHWNRWYVTCTLSQESFGVTLITFKPIWQTIPGMRWSILIVWQ